MLRFLAVVCAIFAVSVSSQNPAPCIAPNEFHCRISRFDHGRDIINRYIFIYDAPNKRYVLFEEMDLFTPGKKFYEFMSFSNENVMYSIDLRSRECTKSIPEPWHPFEIPGNATFVGEYVMGGPGESFIVQEWSDEIPYKKSAMLYIQFSLTNCYPVKEVRVANNELNSTVTTNFYDLVTGIPNPNDFIVPKECMTAKWAPSPLFGH